VKFLKQGLLVLVLAVVFGVGLTAVQRAVGPIIERNQKDETYKQIPSLVLGAEATADCSIQTREDVVTVTKTSDGSVVAKLRVTETSVRVDGKEFKVYRAVKADAPNELVGWVITAQGIGYADTIKALLGLDPEAAKITGVYILDQKETPGLGSKITTPWNEQYDNQPTDKPLVVVKGMTPEQKALKDGKIDAISGATISSNSLTDIINRAVVLFQQARKDGELIADPEAADTTRKE
jgi:electron transport complex protein RnfG